MEEISNEVLLTEIRRLQLDLKERLDTIELRLSKSERHAKEVLHTQEKQDADIKTLFDRVNELCENKAIWKSKSKRETAIRSEDAEKAFEQSGFSSLEALRLLDKTNRLSRPIDGRHMKKSVRVQGRVVRAVVIIED